jgi:hypothetical protein
LRRRRLRLCLCLLMADLMLANSYLR